MRGDKAGKELYLEFSSFSDSSSRPEHVIKLFQLCIINKEVINMYGFTNSFTDSDGSVFYYDVVYENDTTYYDGLCHSADGTVYMFTQAL